MGLLEKASIPTKLKLVILSTAMLSVIFVIGGFFVYEQITYKETIAKNLEMGAQIIAENINTSFAVSDSANVSRVLNSLKSQPRILDAAIYGQEGKVFATYTRADQTPSFSPKPGPDGWRSEEDFLLVYKPIMLNGKRLGTIYMSTDLLGRDDHLRSYLQIAFVVLICSLGIAYVVATRLQRKISQPILGFAEAAKRVAEQKDYSVRVPKQTNDEIGFLAEVFNESLAQIQKRESDLEQKNKAIADEIAERKRVEEELKAVESRYRTTLDHMMEGCQIIAFDGRYLYMNDAAAAQSHTTRENLIGHTMMETYPGIETSPFFEHLERCMVDRVPHRMENEFTYRDGTKGWFNLSMEPVLEGTFILSADITEERKLNEEIRKQREHLQNLDRERTAQLEVVNKELESFSYSVSHDLRAPLRHIHGFAELLTKHADGMLDEKGHRLLTTISSSAKKMGILIDELLVFSRMGRSEMRATVVDLNQMVEETLVDLQAECKDRKIEWSIGRLPCVHADPSMMRLVFVNLLSNAVKYTRTREHARIEIGCDTGDNGITFFIRDNGVGFDMLYENKLFGIFQRLHRAEDFEGTGIGLANVRRIIQRHGGKTWAEGAIDKGATFYFSLPAEKVPHPDVSFSRHTEVTV